ncbi:MFS transporter [Larsenimonas rhizosphaerae]|uniref:MFS transporter n=1 Tax=Larsenimonas rhizosphaerae TaxID=2944682 RepID=UPI0020345684|nr:MFS transporter [Larsenimonas rhizosphaerae]MCM2129463.1 MFS transporter [Larsenimonas rhizosphaerae]
MPHRLAHSLSGARGLAAIAFVFTVTMLGTTLPAPLYPIYEQQFGYSALIITVIFATYAVGVLLALVVSGPWSDQLGRRPMLAVGLVCALASNLFFMSDGTLWWLLAGRFLSGLSAGLFTATATVAVIELAPERLKNRAAIIATAANMGGLGLGPLTAGALAQYLPSPLVLPYAVHTLLIVVAGGLLWQCHETVTRPDRPRLHRQSFSVPREVRAVFIPASIACFAGFCVMGLFTSLVPNLMGQLLHIDNHLVVGASIFLLFMGSTLGQMIQRRLPAHLRLPLSTFTLLVGLGCLLVAIMTGQFGWLITSAVMAGTGQGGSFGASISTVAGQSPKAQRGEVTALLFVVAYVALSLPVVGLGLAVTLMGLKAAGLLFTGLVMVLAAVALAGLLRLRHSQT